ncbi:MAG: T9SS type A sorting domain-containing protein [Candidatus Latescibacteria bacterium]|nr:T9SS type A sorting domain-containing protein [Candidatus Latescibacterota bacterium]NIO28353.1 T9SS type A sorting domain-containing protein [Candidatus Latescibacterota bacterium]NIO55902.1 T9SS type A sorting domain-containing protein [Candidatus Latescibacterota bacterium]NIT01866.1 T9SS type A sorting domain-containing protein [Candidatus Latescibacterota bacterium]
MRKHSLRSRFPRPHEWMFAIPCCVLCLSVFSYSGAPTTERGDQAEGVPYGATHKQVAKKPSDVLPVVNATAPPEEISPAADQLELPDEARWENGELIPPLPRDPQKREEAMAQLRAKPPVTALRPGDVVYYGVPSAMKVEPKMVWTDDARPKIKPYIPPEVLQGERTHNLKLPDEFTLSKEELQRLSEEHPASQDDGPMAPQAPALIQDFEGIDQTTLTPPDCDIAAGPEHVMVVVNSSFAIYDKCGNNLREETFASFLGDATNFLFDPKVIYDAFDGRWVMSIVARNNATSEGYVVIIVSDDNNPVGAWWSYYFDFTLDGGTPTNNWPDYPDIGMDHIALYITSNQFTFPPYSFQYAKIRILDKSEIYNAVGASWYDFRNMLNPGDNLRAFTLRPSKMRTLPPQYWLVNSVSYGGNFLTLWAITDPLGTPSLTGYNVPVVAYDDPPPVIQPNGTRVDCGDARLQNASYGNGRLWTGCAERHNWGEADDRSRLQMYQINTNTQSIFWELGWGSPGYYYAYPAVDFDISNRGIVCFSRGGPTEFIGTRYADLSLGGPLGASALLVAGLANYAGGGSGTLSNPYRWGDYYGCDLDPSDNRTLWFYGQFASDDPIPSWDTHIGATSHDGAGVLSVAPTATFESTGLEGGPFDPPGVTYTLENTGGAALSWDLTNVNSWNTASAYEGQITPGGTQDVTVSINSIANSYAPGTYLDIYPFINCCDGSSHLRTTRLTIGIDGSCPGAIVDLAPDAQPTNFGPDVGTYERGVYITAMKDFEVCAIGWKLVADRPQTLTANIYEAIGTTRGPLVATGSLTAVQAGNVMHYIPIDYTLHACQEYDIAIEYSGTNSFDWWNENTTYEPIDADGVIRVRDGELGGDPSNFALLYFSLIGRQIDCPQMADLRPPDAGTPELPNDDNQERGAYITAVNTIQLCSLGWEADLVAPQILTARIYKATGITRGDMIAEGTMELASSGMRFHDIPIAALLKEGEDYDIAVAFGTTKEWPGWLEATFTLPYTIDDVIQVRDGELDGAAANGGLAHFRVGWGPDIGGAPRILGKHYTDIDVYPPPNVTSYDNSAYGLFVTSLIDQELYALGWNADVPEGEGLTVRVYEATGSIRGALIAEGSAASSEPGMKWHDIPISVTIQSGVDYDFEVEFNLVNTWRWWNDTWGLPYEPFGVIRVTDGEHLGDGGNTAIIDMRMYSCDATLTSVAERPPAKVPFYLGHPSPNPISGTSLIRYSLEEPGPVELRLYDVGGRRAATLFSNPNIPAGPRTYHFDSNQFASGVYFLRLKSQQKMVSRKVVIVH